MRVLLFEEAMNKAAGLSAERHVLLGNGFSIACRPDCFTYARLFDEADFTGLEVDAAELFGLVGTTDFERVIEALRIASTVTRLYDDPESMLQQRLGADAEVLRDALARVLAANHPDDVGEVESAEYAAARRFLSNFSGKIYTVNYDLLLYWTLLQEMEPEISTDDGFRTDPDDPDADWVVWDGYAGHRQRIFHLHGGLHLYDAGACLKKLTWIRTGVPLIDQIRTALEAAVYPLVVTEGSSDEKLARIEHSPYLHRGLKSLTQTTGSIFIHGHSLAENDDHILRRIEQGKFHTLFVGLHGDPESEDNQLVRQRAALMVERRADHRAARPLRYRQPLGLFFYDSGSAGVWTSE